MNYQYHPLNTIITSNNLSKQTQKLVAIASDVLKVDIYLSTFLVWLKDILDK